MGNTVARLRRQITKAGDLQAVVRTLKALPGSNIGQCEQSVRALADYARCAVAERLFATLKWDLVFNAVRTPDLRVA